MKEMRQNVDVSQVSDTGKVRANNEDAFGWFTIPAGELFLVADGVGGSAGGEVASKCAIKAFSEAMQKASGHPGEALSQALLYADRRVRELGEADPALRGCGTTIVALLLTPAAAWHIHAGDSRVYRFSQGKLRQLGRDHSSVQDMLAAGLITEEQARSAPKNVITQCLGGNVNAGYCKPEQVACCRGDKFLLCTDGLWGMVEDAEIEAILRASQDVEKNVAALHSAALDAGGRDNVTLQVVECLTGPEAPLNIQAARPRTIPRAAVFSFAAAGILFLCLLGVGVYGLFSPPQPGESVTAEQPEPKASVREKSGKLVMPSPEAQGEAQPSAPENSTPAPETVQQPEEKAPAEAQQGDLAKPAEPAPEVQGEAPSSAAQSSEAAAEDASPSAQKAPAGVGPEKSARTDDGQAPKTPGGVKAEKAQPSAAPKASTPAGGSKSFLISGLVGGFAIVILVVLGLAALFRSRAKNSLPANRNTRRRGR